MVYIEKYRLPRWPTGRYRIANSSKGNDINMHATTPFRTTAEARARRVVHRTRGHSHGPITRLVSPSDVGELIKPFVFLDYFEIDPNHMPPIGFHPHSGIATLSLIFEGQITYEETSGTKGIIEPGGVEWMRASSGVWHTGGAVGTARVKGYQLWIALPPEMESIEPEAQYLGGERFQSHGPARVILGRHGRHFPVQTDPACPQQRKKKNHKNRQPPRREGPPLAEANHKIGGGGPAH